MLQKKIIFLMCFILGSYSLQAEESHPHTHHDQTIHIEKLSPLGNLEVISRFHNIHMSGQPDIKTLASLKKQNFSTVINIRGPEEMEFDEKSLVEKNGLTYHIIPLLDKDGEIQDSAVTEILKKVKSIKDGKILLHCSSSNRVATWLASHFYRDHKMPLDEVIAYAKQAGMSKKSSEDMLRRYLKTLK